MATMNEKVQQLTKDLLAKANEINKFNADVDAANRRIKKEAEDLDRYLTWLAQTQAEEAAKKAAKEEADKKAAEERNAAIKAELVAQSDKFERDKAGMGQNLMAVAGEDVRQALGSQLRDVAINANRRGLLFSGMKKKAAAEARDLASQDLMAKQQAVNEDLEAQSQAYKQMAREGVNANQDLIFANMANQQQNAMSNYQLGLQNRRARLNQKQGIRSLIGANQQLKNDFRDSTLKGQPTWDPTPYQTIGQAVGTAGAVYANRKA